MNKIKYFVRNPKWGNQAVAARKCLGVYSSTCPKQILKFLFKTKSFKQQQQQKPRHSSTSLSYTSLSPLSLSSSVFYIIFLGFNEQSERGKE